MATVNFEKLLEGFQSSDFSGSFSTHAYAGPETR